MLNINFLKNVTNLFILNSLNTNILIEIKLNL